MQSFNKILDIYCSKIYLLNTYSSDGSPDALARIFIFIHNKLVPIIETNVNILNQLSDIYIKLSTVIRKKNLLEIKLYFQIKKYFQ